jgi:hypothetical protein
MLSLNVVGFARLPLAEHKDLQLMSIINTRLLAKSTTSLKSPNPFVCRYLVRHPGAISGFMLLSISACRCTVSLTSTRFTRLTVSAES